MGYKIYIDNSPHYASLGIWIQYEEGRKIFMVKPVKMELEEVTEMGALPEPTILIPRYAREDFLQAFAAALNEKNIKTPDEHKLQGILQATQYHLEDMRRLVFGRKK